MVAFNNDAPALCKSPLEGLTNEAANLNRGDAQNGCVAYQIGPMMQVNGQRFVNSKSRAPRANSQESASGFVGGSSQGMAGNTFGVTGGSAPGSVAPDAANEGRMMAVVNLLNSSPGSSFDQAATNDDPSSSNEFIIYDQICNVSGNILRIFTSSPSTSTS